MNPTFIGVPNNGFRSWSDNQLLVKSGRWVNNHAIAILTGFQTVMGHYRTFLSKAFYMFSLTTQKALRNQQWEVCVLHAGSLKHFIKLLLHLFPNSESVWFNYHTSSNRSLLCQISLYNQIIIPLTVIFSSLGQIFQFFCH